MGSRQRLEDLREVYGRSGFVKGIDGLEEAMIDSDKPIGRLLKDEFMDMLDGDKFDPKINADIIEISIDILVDGCNVYRENEQFFQYVIENLHGFILMSRFLGSIYLLSEILSCLRTMGLRNYIKDEATSEEKAYLIWFIASSNKSSFEYMSILEQEINDELYGYHGNTKIPDNMDIIVKFISKNESFKFQILLISQWDRDMEEILKPYGGFRVKEIYLLPEEKLYNIDQFIFTYKYMWTSQDALKIFRTMFGDIHSGFKESLRALEKLLGDPINLNYNRVDLSYHDEVLTISLR